MADSIDRVFSRAVTTIKTLSTRSGYGSLPRPPLDIRIKLYGLYKQATEGNISQDLLNSDLNALGDETILKKYHSWSSNMNLSQLEAKRRYIEILIDTMKVYASGTVESRELLSELEYLYDQIKDLRTDLDGEEDSAVPQLPILSPELQYDLQFQYPAPTQLRSGSSIRNASQSTNNLVDMRSIYNYDRNDSLYSYSGTHNNNNEINNSWKNEITSIINKMIKDLNFFKKLERQRQLDNVNSKKFKLLKIMLRLFGYTLFNVIVMLALLKFNKRTRFLTRTIGI